MENFDKKEKRTLYSIAVLYFVFAIVIAIVGRSYYKGYEKSIREDFNKELTIVTNLKIDNVVQWRKERLQDANVYYKNYVLTEYVKRYFKNPDDIASRKNIESWLGKINDVNDVDAVYLLDEKLNKKIVVPENGERDKIELSHSELDTIKSGKIYFDDFYRYTENQKVFLRILIPVIDESENNILVGIIQIRIDPEVYLYPLINKWPAATKSAEMVIIRGEGNEVVFLNELKKQENTALNKLVPLANDDYVAVKALKGITGIVDGLDYRGVEVLADIQPIPNSPWILAARMNKSEVLEPMKEKFWQTAIIANGLLLIVGLGLLFFWRSQRMRFYQAQYKTAETLKQSEEKFRLLYENSPVPYQSLDSEGRVLEVNTAWLEQLGYTLNEVIGHNISEFLVKEDEPLLKERLPNFIKSGDLHDAEFRFRHKDGRVLTEVVNGKIGYDIKGKFKETHCVLLDITERKKAEDAVKESEKHLKTLYENVSEIIFYISVESEGEFRFKTVNNAFLKTTGLKAEQVEGKLVSNIIPEPSLSVVLSNYRKAVEEKTPVKWEETTPYPTGNKVGDVTITPIFNEEGECTNLIGTVYDITERKEAEEALRESEEKYKSLITSTPLPLCLTDDSGKLVYINDRFTKVFGYTLDDVPTLDEWWTKAYPEEQYRKWVLETWNKAIEDARIKETDIESIEYDVTCKNGDVRTIIIAGIVLKEGFLATFIDVTERKLAEEEVKRFFNITLDHLCIAGTDGYFKKISPSWTKTFGYSEEEFLSKQFFEFIHPDDIEPTTEVIKQLSEQNPVINFVNRYRCKDGTYRWLSWISTPYKDTIYAAAHDITEIKSAEAKLKEAKEKLSLAIEGGEIGIWEWVFETDLTLWDERMELMFGVEVGTFGKDYVSFKACLHPDDIAAAEEAIRKALEENIPYEVIYRIIRKTGEIGYINAKAVVYKDAEGKPEKMLGVCMDITELKLAEEEIRKLNSDLEKRVIERTSQLENANKELESFAYSVSHDLRSPLRAIDGFTKLIKEEYENKFDEEGKRLLGIIRSNTQKMDKLITDLLALSRVNRLETKYSRIDMTTLFDSIYHEIAEPEVLNNFEFKIDKLPDASGDPTLIKQMLLNLLSNSVKFSMKSKIKKIEVGSFKDNGSDVYFVRDYGAGFNPDYKNKLFGVFQRLHSNEEFEGTGVGLAIVQRIIYRHNGKVWAEGKVGEGATFYFVLGNRQFRQ